VAWPGAAASTAASANSSVHSAAEAGALPAAQTLSLGDGNADAAVQPASSGGAGAAAAPASPNASSRGRTKRSRAEAEALVAAAGSGEADDSFEHDMMAIAQDVIAFQYPEQRTHVSFVHLGFSAKQCFIASHAAVACHHLQLVLCMF
jgi:hypothetical protein